MYMYVCISVFDKFLIWHCTVLSLWAYGTVNYDYIIVTNSINCLLIGSMGHLYIHVHEPL